MWVKQGSRTEHGAVFKFDLPPIGVVIPTCIRMGQRHMDRVPPLFGSQNFGGLGQGQGREKQGRGNRGQSHGISPSSVRITSRDVEAKSRLQIP